jgi:hypothetical protein
MALAGSVVAEIHGSISVVSGTLFVFDCTGVDDIGTVDCVS